MLMVWNENNDACINLPVHPLLRDNRPAVVVLRDYLGSLDSKTRTRTRTRTSTRFSPRTTLSARKPASFLREKRDSEVILLWSFAKMPLTIDNFTDQTPWEARSSSDLSFSKARIYFILKYWFPGLTVVIPRFTAASTFIRAPFNVS